MTVVEEGGMHEEAGQGGEGWRRRWGDGVKTDSDINIDTASRGGVTSLLQ